LAPQAEPRRHLDDADDQGAAFAVDRLRDKTAREEKIEERPHSTALPRAIA